MACPIFKSEIELTGCYDTVLNGPIASLVKEPAAAMDAHIVIIDDEASIREVLRFSLEDAGMRVTEHADGKSALSKLTSDAPDLVVLDIGMPGMDGFQTCREIRQHSQVPILFLTARDDEIDRVLSFELGGDDHVSKPFSPRELLLRIRAILRRRDVVDTREEVLRFEDLEMIPAQHLCRLDGRNVSLTGIEFGVLATLLRAPAQIRSRNQIIEAVYGSNTNLSDRTVDSHLRNIRQKALALGYDDIIETVHGIGVKLGRCCR